MKQKIAAGLWLSALRPGFDRDPLDSRIVLRAPGADIRVIFERVVNDPAVVGIERISLERSPGRSNRLGKMADFFYEGVVAHGAVVLDVYDHTLAGRILRSKDAIDEILEVIDDSVVASDEMLRFVGEDLEDEVAVALLLLDLDNKS